ncbi:MAG: transcription antitermination factor NusB [Betaproteobacteria bacterium HGW-Betaproteobacteria-1]|jgi:N utilization substance protein B|nr:MAG: transcription antitermination factor NusB [Betaproteobacteria bacterium HGW-Betaproteobacteria-1]
MSAAENKPSTAKLTKPGKNRRKSRELALKGIYQGLMNQSEVRKIIRDMADDVDFHRADEAFFRQLIEGVAEHMQDLEQRIAVYVDRQVAELSPVEHAILCLSAYELIYDPTIPYRVVINEGVELAKIYGGIDGHKYVNGVLDKLAAEARPQEVAQRR